MIDARRFNCWIVTRDREFLQAYDMERRRPIFSANIFDSAPLPKWAAQKIARRICGWALSFNHVTGKFVK